MLPTNKIRWSLSETGAARVGSKITVQHTSPVSILHQKQELLCVLTLNLDTFFLHLNVLFLKNKNKLNHFKVYSDW